MKRSTGRKWAALRRLLAMFVQGILIFSPELGRAQTAIPIIPLSRALKAIGMTPDDLRIKSSYLDRDPCRFRIVEELLGEPLRTPAYVRDIAHRFREAGTLREWLSTLARVRRTPAASDRHSRPVQDPPERQRSHPPISLSPHLPIPEVQRAVVILLSGIQDARDMLVEAFADVSLVERNAACDRLSSPGPRAASLDEDMLALCRRVDENVLLSAGVVLTHAVDRAWEILSAVTIDSMSVRGDVARWDTPFGEVLVGGKGPTTYAEDAALILDLGGDDEYLARAGGACPDLPVSLCVDLSGDDRYVSDVPYTQGAAAFGIGVLVDGAGDDVYVASSSAQGCGVAGIGILLDREGSDRYEGDTFVQGAAAFGIGALWDSDGPDAYCANLFSQGFGFVGGVGVLMERGGDDTYFAGGTYPDLREKGRYTQSLSQGFGYGYRDRASGGIGILADYRGNDAYCAEYFGQGAAYWYAMGILFDGAGNDRYVARRYAQGAGTHLCVGALLDEGGDDRYLSWGVSQGCGHDLAVGMLLDAGGEDAYASDWLSQGAGNANGIGLLVDERGDDRYEDTGQSRGYGASAREYGSIGVLLDLSGADEYAGTGADGALWTQGEYGVGLDDDRE